MGAERLGLSVTKRTYTPEGDIVDTTYRDARYFLSLPAFDVHNTGIHESLHGVAAELSGTSVVKMTSNRNGDALGSTTTASPSAIAAGASTAFGCDGDGVDRWIVQALRSPGAPNAARNLLERGNGIAKVRNVAGALAENGGDLDGHGVRKAMDEVDKAEEFNRQGITVVDVFVRTRDGKTARKKDIRIKATQVKDPITMAEGEGIQLSKKEDTYALAA